MKMFGKSSKKSKMKSLTLISPPSSSSSSLSLFTSSILSFVLIVATVSSVWTLEEDSIDQDVVQNMVKTFGRELSSVSTEQTCLGSFEQRFQAYSQDVSWFDANKMLDDMKTDVKNMLSWKKHLVVKIANESERLAANHTYDKNIEFEYKNVKNLSVSVMAHPNFKNAMINLDNSAIHVPTNVFNQSADIINDIKWSESLTQFFKNNMAFDPNLSWQFFGSAKGILRLYPATRWSEPPNLISNYEQPDFYDCRMRPWYIYGAASPKDIVILLDTSGSNTGMRRKIGIEVVKYILDTLTDNDYVAAFKFAKSVEPISPCIKSLVQANKKNIIEIKNNLEEVRTSDMVNITAALEEAFSLLQTYNRSNQGSQCNQAIMLVTDGAPDNYEGIFSKYNWPNIPVRVFTYLIGHDATATDEVYWMACHNRGYYTHVSDLGVVHEQVQKYIPVMSRPIVLSRERIFTWTPIYAQTSKLELDNTNWNNKKKFEQFEQTRQRYQREMGSEQSSKNEDEVDDVVLYTTLATPVFDTRNYTNITTRILIKNVYQDAEVETIRIANLLGVAGIDVPIKEIEKSTPAYKLGVNGYAFIISNNGYLLNHPDLRPMYEGFLKPFYSSVDMSEVELANNTFGPRVPDLDIESIRKNMIDRRHGWKNVTVKIHIDNMKRVMTRVNHYTHGMVDETPFSLAIVLPEPYGSYRLTAQVDLRMKLPVENFSKYFSGKQWRVHPEWSYCDTPRRHEDQNISSEESIRKLLSTDHNKQTFRWRTSSMRPHVHGDISCDKDLIQSLVLDASLTDTTNESCSSVTNFKDEQRVKTFGIVSTFVATRSGLTRFKDYRPESEIPKNPFYLKHNRAIDETYYKRAVDFYIANNDSFVYSVDFDAGAEYEKKSHSQSHLNANFLVTATHAIFIGNAKQSAPVSVVGIQFRYNVLHEFFLNTTTKFNVPCTHIDVDCYLIDNNAFTLLSNRKVSDVGQFFGQIDGDILEELVSSGVYRRIHMFDYQAMCFDTTTPSGPSIRPFVFSFVSQIGRLISNTATTIATLYLNLLYDGWSVYSFQAHDRIVRHGKRMAESVEMDGDLDEEEVTRPCDKEFDLYEMVDFSNFTRSNDVVCGKNPDCSRKFTAQYIPHTNLIFVLVINNPSCDCPKNILSIEPKEVVYENATQRCEMMEKERYRKRPEVCYNYHPQEKDIRQCGSASTIDRMSALLALATLSHTLLYKLYSIALF